MHGAYTQHVGLLAASENLKTPLVSEKLLVVMANRLDWFFPRLGAIMREDGGRRA